MMTRQELLNAIIDDGITEIPLAYPRPDQADKRAGAIAGFEACRMLDDGGIHDELDRARVRTTKAMTSKATDYWWHRLYELQVEWTANVLSAAYSAHGQTMSMIITPTARGMAKAADILGVAA